MTQTYEDNLNELKEIIRRLESGSIPLEETLTLYERGMELIRNCEKMLESAELKIALLQES
ncbi:exodeoxyribonuclease VII small subunit [Methanogenium organophilum]|uniref:Exodeoxyribonuclease VII small subunit n=1 Tax=Methanogenium organophilum TaxID=2199 RepID=A0A9X9S385_METOG|nr:exodeoxyribonuclease VII small subunit [Methanogenium organophilum]WAI00726.1 exodeoxyribonuclease VII small subunit [Methanogenium organophilum]